MAIAHALKDLPVTVVGTPYDSSNGRYTGALRSPPCFGSEKVDRMEAWLSASGLDWAAAAEAWGDSPSDWPLMQKCGKRVWVCRSDQKTEVLKGIDPEGQHLRISAR
jgi:phosphoserine phosphatase